MRCILVVLEFVAIAVSFHAAWTIRAMVFPTRCAKEFLRDITTLYMLRSIVSLLVFKPDVFAAVFSASAANSVPGIAAPTFLVHETWVKVFVPHIYRRKVQGSIAHAVLHGQAFKSVQMGNAKAGTVARFPLVISPRSIEAPHQCQEDRW